MSPNTQELIKYYESTTKDNFNVLSAEILGKIKADIRLEQIRARFTLSYLMDIITKSIVKMTSLSIENITSSRLFKATLIIVANDIYNYSLKEIKSALGEARYSSLSNIHKKSKALFSTNDFLEYLSQVEQPNKVVEKVLKKIADKN